MFMNWARVIYQLLSFYQCVLSFREENFNLFCFCCFSFGDFIIALFHAMETPGLPSFFLHLAWDS